jgi:hypothetical protein
VLDERARMAREIRHVPRVDGHRHPARSRRAGG